MENPFAQIDGRLRNIETFVLDIKHDLIPKLVSASIPEERPLTRAQAAEFLQVTPPTLDSWVKVGLVERRVIANEIRFLPSDLLAALKRPEINRVQSRKNKKA